MDEGRPLTDAALDREISAALGVEPSPDFLARVRQRVAGEPAPMPRWSRPFAATAAGALLLAAAVWSWPEGERTPLRPAPIPEVVPVDARSAGSAPASEASDSPAEMPVRETRPVLARADPDAKAAPVVAIDTWEERFSVVILAENERKALRWLGAATRIPPPEPSEITVSTQRAADQRPALPPPSFESPGVGQLGFERVRLE